MVEITLELLDLMTPLAAALEPGAAAIVLDTAERIAAAAQVNIMTVGAVDTAAMLLSVDAVPGEEPLTAYAGPTVDYSGFVEEGTVHMPARPFMAPAVEAEREPFEVRMQELLNGQ